jgi:hypothetical protein
LLQADFDRIAGDLVEVELVCSNRHKLVRCGSGQLVSWEEVEAVDQRLGYSEEVLM